MRELTVDEVHSGGQGVVSTEQGHRWFAATYDRLSASAERSTVGRLRRELLATVTGDVVEIGAGTGANFAHYPAGARVVAPKT